MVVSAEVAAEVVADSISVKTRETVLVFVNLVHRDIIRYNRTHKHKYSSMILIIII